MPRISGACRQANTSLPMTFGFPMHALPCRAAPTIYKTESRRSRLVSTCYPEAQTFSTQLSTTLRVLGFLLAEAVVFSSAITRVRAIIQRRVSIILLSVQAPADSTLVAMTMLCSEVVPAQMAPPDRVIRLSALLAVLQIRSEARIRRLAAMPMSLRQALQMRLPSARTRRLERTTHLFSAQPVRMWVSARPRRPRDSTSWETH